MQEHPGQSIVNRLVDLGGDVFMNLCEKSMCEGFNCKYSQLCENIKNS